MTSTPNTVHDEDHAELWDYVHQLERRLAAAERAVEDADWRARKAEDAARDAGYQADEAKRTADDARSSATRGW